MRQIEQPADQLDKIVAFIACVSNFCLECPEPSPCKELTLLTHKLLWQPPSALEDPHKNQLVEASYKILQRLLVPGEAEQKCVYVGHLLVALSEI